MPSVRRCKPSFLALCLSLVLAVCAGEALATPAGFSAAYKVTRNLFDRDLTLASAALQLERGSNGRYRYTSQLNPVRLVALIYGERLTEVSRGSITPTGVMPDLYEMRLEGRRPRAGSLVFDRASGEIVQTFKQNQVRQRVPEGKTLDRLSMQLALASDLAAGERDMQYLMADQNRLRVYRFEVTGEERLRTRVGEFDTLKVELTGRLRVEDAEGMDVDEVETVDDFGDENRTAFWFAPELDYLPVRIQHVDDDLGTFRMEIERLDQPPSLSARGASGD